MPPKEVSYKLSDISTVKKILPCEAEAEPPATYEWTKDDEPLTITGVDIKKKPGVGTLIIEHPTEDHEGIYQCRATNEYGTAVAVKTKFRAARLEPFATKLQPTVHKPEVGTPLILRCNPPNSYPEPSVYWGESKPGSKLRPIDTDDRISLDFDGNMYFANIKMSDARNGKRYVCIASNHIIRGLVQGDDQVIRPFRRTDDEVTTKYQAVKLMWSSPSPDTAIAGTEKILKCIFSGFPTPILEWRRVDKELSDKIYFINNKLSLVIPDVDYDDAGIYECSAYNVKGGLPVRKTIRLEVESIPTFVEKPENEVKAEEEDVTFTCRAGGKPRPKVEWSINGLPVEKAEADSRRSYTEDTLTIRNLTKTDSQVIQCNISNRHGYNFENAYLNVLAEPPTWLAAPATVTKVAEGQQAMIHCRTFGAPEPVITWTVDDELIPDKFEVLDNGTLLIRDVYQQDEGTYKCHAANKFGDIEQSGQLIVRSATVITTAPSDKTVNASSTVTFECDASTDREEQDHLEIKWLKGGEEIDYESEPSITLNKRDHTLTISPTRVTDSGEFMCVADNGLDRDSVTANLIVKDRPDPPSGVSMAECGSTHAEITWVPGNENNDEVIAFYVYYNTSFDEKDQFHQGAEVLRGTEKAKIGLSPWANYTFHVRAKNSLGMSDRSEFTTVVCKTQASIPMKNPDGVCTDSRDPSELVITWKPMDRIDHNGPNFHYIIAYRRTDGSDGDQFIKEHITDYTQSEFVLPGTETFEEFEIYVQAANAEGTTRPNRLKKRYGYSGEGVPDVTPTNFAIDESTLNATSAVFTWTGVDENPDIMKGHLVGYDIVFWKADDPENKRINTVIAGPFEPCPLVRSRNKRQAGETVEGHVLNLWPFSDIQAGVLVKNSKHSGDLSDPPISFTTPEGVPGKVMMFEVQERGSHHFVVGWEPPSEPNGILLGYNLGHRPANDPNAEITRHYVDDPLKRSTKLKGLEPDREYILYIWARTNAGVGDQDWLEDKTIVAGPVDTPKLTDFIHGESSLNASWVPSTNRNPQNPGSDFYVKYRKLGKNNWTTVEPEDPDENSVNITGLTFGEQYEVMVVAVDGDGKEKPSEPVLITLGQNPEPVTQSVASAGWFIGMMCAIIFLLLVLIIVCLIKRNRGGKYPVHEKEKLRGRDPDKEDEEGGFGEYTRTDEPDYKKSAGSINDETKPLGESDSDSMAEYDETDPSKFNEDGSFIGQYGGKKTGDAKMEPDATSPSALSTFV